MRRIVAGCGAMTLCALAMFAWRASAQNDLASTTPAAPTPIVRTLVRNAAASGVAVDPQGRLNYAASDHVARVIVANISTGTSAAAPLVAAGNSERGSLGDGGPATSAQLNLADVTAKSPSAGSGIAIDPAGNLFIADTLNDTIRRVDAETGVISSVAGKWASSVAPDGFTNPIGAAVDATGNLYVTANNVVYRLDAQTGAMKPIANVAGAAAIAVTRDGTEIYAVGLSTGNIFQIAEAGSDVRSAGQASGAVLSVFATSSAPGPGTPAHLSGSPTGIAVDANANVFVSEATANLIERVDARTNRVTQIAGTGAAGYSGDGGAPLKAQFDAPGALAFDRSGNLFVADIGNGVIREITNASPAQASGVTLSPNTFNFGDQLTGGTTAAQAFTLTNNTSNSVSAIGVNFVGGATPADFTQANTCMGTLAAGAACAINVSFAPQASGQRNATLYVTDSDPSSPQTAAVTGTGDNFDLAVQPNGTYQLTVENGFSGTYQLEATPDNTFSGTVTLNCPYNLPDATTCTITTPSGSTPPTTLTLTAGGPPQTFTATFKTTYRTTTTGPSNTMIAPAGGTKPEFPAPPKAGIAIAAAGVFLAALGAAMWISLRGARTGKFRWSKVGIGIATLLIGAIPVISSGCNTTNTGPTTMTIYEGTPAGTYNMTLTATAQGATRGVSITLIVQ